MSTRLLRPLVGRARMVGVTPITTHQERMMTTSTSTSRQGAATRRRRTTRLVPLLAAAFGVTALAWSASPASAAGTGSISGTVRNNAGVPVPGTHVVITELGRQAVTGADGTYS